MGRRKVGAPALNLDKHKSLIMELTIKGLTRTEVAQHLGIGPATLQRFLRKRPQFRAQLQQATMEAKKKTDVFVIEETEVKTVQTVNQPFLFEGESYKLLNPKELEEILNSFSSKEFNNEQEFEEYCVEFLPRLFSHIGWEASEIMTQKSYSTNFGRIKPDILIKHKNGAISVVECKYSKQRNDQLNAIGQLLVYRSALERLFNVTPHIIIADHTAYKGTMIAIKDFDLPITLMAVKKGVAFAPHVQFTA